MQQRLITYALVGVWLVIFVASFVVAELTMEGRNEVARGLSRLAALLTWQGIAFVVAVVLAFVTYRSASGGDQRSKVIGYAPLAISVFLLVSFILIMAYRFYVAPLLPS